MNKLSIIFITIFLLGCHRAQEEHFAAINNFNLKPEILKDNDPVKLIYCSRQNDRNDPMTYLIQFVAVKVETGDTINILSNRSDHLKETDGDKIFHYKHFDETLTALITASKEDLKKIIDNDSVKADELSVLSDGHLIMVAQDPKFREIEENKFPTVLGEIVR